MTCRARRHGDQYHCHACGYQWDVQDEDRPMCKHGNTMRALGVALMLSVASVASAAGLDCDGSRVAELTTSTLEYAEVCATTLDEYGAVAAYQSVQCQMARVESQKQYAAVQDLARQGCTTYYAGPSKAQVRRLGELGDKFQRVGR